MPQLCGHTLLAALSSPLFFNVTDDIANGPKPLGNIIGDRNVEFLFKFHDEFDRIERIRAQFSEQFSERGTGRDVVRRDTNVVGELALKRRQQFSRAPEKMTAIRTWRVAGRLREFQVRRRAAQRATAGKPFRRSRRDGHIILGAANVSGWAAPLVPIHWSLPWRPG